MTWEPEFGEGPQRTPPPASAPPGEREPTLITELRDGVSLHDNPNLRNEWGPELLAAWDARSTTLAPSPRRREPEEDALTRLVEEIGVYGVQTSVTGELAPHANLTAAIETLRARLARAEQERDEARAVAQYPRYAHDPVTPVDEMERANDVHYLGHLTGALIEAVEFGPREGEIRAQHAIHAAHDAAHARGRAEAAQMRAVLMKLENIIASEAESGALMPERATAIEGGKVKCLNN